MIRAPSFPPLVWVVLAGTLVTRTAFFMVWPFLAVILDREFGLPPSTIGSILGSGFMASALVGFYSGNLSDRWGRRVLMLGGCSGAVVAYVVLATAASVPAYVLGASLVGLSRSVLEAPGKALIADCLDDQDRRELAFHARYFLINVGGALGPLLGLIFGLSARQASFWITAAVYAGFAVAMVLVFRRTPETARRGTSLPVTLQAAVGVLRRDRAFLWMILAMFLSMLAYAQQESTLIQYITIAGGVSAISLVASLLMTNALTIVVCQFPLLRRLGRYDQYLRIYVGIALFGVAFVAYAVLPVRPATPWIVATFVLSVGEAVLFPTLNVQVDRMAPGSLRGSYFGAASLGGLGFGAGPFVGGFLLESMGGHATFGLAALTIALCGSCYWQSSRRAPAVTPHEAPP